MKTLKKIAITAGLVIFISTLTMANQESSTESAPKSPIDNLVSFKVISTSGVNYLNWKVKGEKQNCIYVIEASEDGECYDQVAIKHGYATNLEIVLLYSWSMEVSENNHPVYYRVKRITADGMVSYSPLRQLSDSADGMICEWSGDL